MRYHEQPAQMRQVFVFGSNLLGIHGKGAALTAKRKYGYPSGRAEGLAIEYAMAYAIPTKATPRRSLPLEGVAEHVARFVDCARFHLEWEFYVTRIGCGLAGFKDEQIAPMFRAVPTNCIMPPEWRPWLEP